MIIKTLELLLNYRISWQFGTDIYTVLDNQQGPTI